MLVHNIIGEQYLLTAGQALTWAATSSAPNRRQAHVFHYQSLQQRCDQCLRFIFLIICSAIAKVLMRSPLFVFELVDKLYRSTLISSRPLEAQHLRLYRGSHIHSNSSGDMMSNCFFSLSLCLVGTHNEVR